MRFPDRAAAEKARLEPRLTPNSALYDDFPSTCRLFSTVKAPDT